MKRRSAHVHPAVAGLLALLLMAASAVPAAGEGGGRSWAAEDLAFRLVNCLRTGGLVTADGTCKGYGSGKYSAPRPPLERSTTISDQVAWPWARRSVRLHGRRSCWVGHSLAGSTVDGRFAAAGLTSQVNGESVGCARYRAKKMVVFIVRLWQREKHYRGWHWRQLKDERFRSMGIGVAKRGKGKSQLAVNFYGEPVP